MLEINFLISVIVTLADPVPLILCAIGVWAAPGKRGIWIAAAVVGVILAAIAWWIHEGQFLHNRYAEANLSSLTAGHMAAAFIAGAGGTLAMWAIYQVIKRNRELSR